MKIRNALTAVLVVATMGFIADGHAKTISIKGNSEGQVKGRCGKSGGTSWPKTADTATYGCINKNGSGIVCGGVTTKHKQTCDTFAQAPPDRLPTRAETAKAAAVEKGRTR